ncbi:FBP domain-containing protein [Streptacidiphilus carbonis]|uniref:FBP domain-containing protein n=1 Tax=Streptacidiphilus carbonis TaxID=105422 RepID=UPI0005AB775A|nr:FBP domain-containing protein [Streptacidiphilus carbonis]
MKAASEQDIRASFINCTKGEAKRLPVPRDLADRPWNDLDFLGWTDLSAPDRSYLVTARDGVLVGLTLRYPSQRRGLVRRSMCSLCLTTHPGDGVSLMVARKAGPAGREGNSVGIYLCTDLACSLYLRGLRTATGMGARLHESLTLEQQIERTQGKLYDFLDAVAA